MIDGELTKMRDNAREKIDFLEVSNEFLIDLVFDSLSFESVLLSREEVIQVLNGKSEGVDPGVVLLINNQKNAYLHIVNMVKEDIPMTENNLKDLHQVIMNGVSDIGGLYRNVDISIKGSNHTPPSHIKVYDRMRKYFDATLGEPTNNLLDYISYCHLQLAKIHPFLDGNGRLSRMVLNYQLLRHGLMPITISPTQRNIYFDCLEEFKVNKNISPFVRFIENIQKDSLSHVL